MSLEVRDLRFSYGEHEVLKGLSFTAEYGQLLSVLAPMAVLVLSSTHKREPRFCFSLRVSVNSRFLLVELSRSMYLLVK